MSRYFDPEPPGRAETDMPREADQRERDPEEEVLERLSHLDDPLLAPRRLGVFWRTFIVLSTALAAAAGGTIGVAVARLGCEGCSILTLVGGGAIGAVFAGSGVSVLTVLTARSFDEWRRTRQPGDPARPAQS